MDKHSKSLPPISNLSSVEYYGIDGFHPSINGMIVKVYETVFGYPKFTRTYIDMDDNCALMNESFMIQLRMMPMPAIFGEKISDLVVTRITSLDNAIKNLAKDTVKTNAYPIAVLNLNLKPRMGDTAYYVNYSDFKYYLEYNTGVVEVEIPEVLKRMSFMKLDYRIIKENNNYVPQPMRVNIFATSAWNKKPLSTYANLCPFVEPSDASVDKIYASYECPEIYVVDNLFLSFSNPIFKDSNSVVTKFDGIPQYQLLCKNTKELVFPSVMYLKIQNWGTLDIRKHIIETLKNIVSMTQEIVRNIPEDESAVTTDSGYHPYNSFINFMSSFAHTIKPEDPYTLDRIIKINDETKDSIHEYLEMIFTTLD